jgi:hypothetical protein
MEMFGEDCTLENIQRIESVAEFVRESKVGKGMRHEHVVQQETDLYRLCFYARGASRELMSGFYESVGELDLSSCWQ